MKLMISGCLMGFRCRYDGGTQKLPCLDELMEKYELYPVCPEVMGGLPTPREPSEIVGDRVISRVGTDVTEQYHRGAQEAAVLAQLSGCTIALLKERSPSCGCGKVYDGTFSKTLTDGNGITADYLLKEGVKVYGESQVDLLLKDNPT